jgi:hypothetical protein
LHKDRVASFTISQDSISRYAKRSSEKEYPVGTKAPEGSGKNIDSSGHVVEGPSGSDCPLRGGLRHQGPKPCTLNETESVASIYIKVVKHPVINHNASSSRLSGSLS